MVLATAKLIAVVLVYMTASNKIAKAMSFVAGEQLLVMLLALRNAKPIALL